MHEDQVVTPEPCEVRRVAFDSVRAPVSRSLRATLAHVGRSASGRVNNPGYLRNGTEPPQPERPTENLCVTLNVYLSITSHAASRLGESDCDGSRRRF